MTVADEHGVEVAGSHPFQQPRHRRVARIDQQPEAVVLGQVAAARLAGLRPGAARAKNSQPPGTP
jgi:hypothetical protein